MREGLYKAEFHTVHGTGTGVLYATSGKLRGGNSAFAFSGSYTGTGDEIVVRISTQRHNDDPAFKPLFGTDMITLTLKGTETDDMVDQSHVFPGARSDYGVPSEIFSTLIGYSTKAFPASGPRPASFADFWDVQKFPGKRSLPDKPATVLEAALLADGVKPGEVYATLSTPAGMERALAKIRALRPNVAVWWSSGAQPVQALGSGDAVMALGWNGRFQAGMDDGLPIAMAWEESVPQVGYFMIVKGAPNKAAAVKFLRFIETPEAQSRFSQYVAYGPTTPEALPLIDAKRLERLPSTAERLKNALFMDVKWWAEHGQEATEKYTAVMQGN